MAKKYDRSVSENEKRVINNISIIDYYNNRIVPKRADRRFYNISTYKKQGICPFHPDNDPSFSLFGDNLTVFKCFGCNAAGNIINLHQRWLKEEYNQIMNYKTALINLAQLYNVELEIDEKTGEIKEEDPFEIARRRMGFSNNDSTNKKIVSDGINDIAFMKLNNEVKKRIEQMSQVYEVSDEQAIKMYHRIDLMLSESLAFQKDVSNARI